MTRHLTTLTTLILATLLSAAASHAASPEEKKAAPATGKLAIYDRVSEADLAIDAASKTAFSAGRRLLVNFGTNDCELCAVVNDAIFEEPFTSFFFTEFVPVFVDVTPGTKNAEQLKRFGIDPSRPFPAVVLSDRQMKIQEVTKSGELAEVAKKGKKAVQQWLSSRFTATSKESN